MLLFLASTGAVVATTLVACSGNDAGPAPEKPVLSGRYVAAGAGSDISQMTFYGKNHYWLSKSPCANEIPCMERGTFALDDALTALSLSDESTGQTRVLPIKNIVQEGAVPSSETKTSALERTVRAESLIGPDGGGLVGDAGALLCDAGPLTACNEVSTAPRVASMEVGDGAKFQADPTSTTNVPSDNSCAPATPATTSHEFTIETKNFIAPVDNVGHFILGDNKALAELAVATNLAYKEDPKDGSKDSAKYRLWVSVTLSVTCTGTKASMKMNVNGRDVGKEGPLKGDETHFSSKSTDDGRFYYLMGGRPNVVAEPAFQLVRPRTNRSIWYSVSGRVTCSADGDATLTIGDGDVVNTSFPSFRLWTGKKTNGTVVYRDRRDFDRKQAVFTELWNLSDVPSDPSEFPSTSPGCTR
ncbi:hypothetical protein LVJ94_14860 [Pendulispora rubella]|uniref:Lipoprotein n=1 Tax=Pendulispora rubella TaxID=2741070 RepID=A0ABZ2LC82_9BACT